jgi:two-component sensor histidine kinase
MISRPTLRQSWRAWFSFKEPLAGPAWLQFVWTAVFCLVVAAGFTLLGLATRSPSASAASLPCRLVQWYWVNLVITLCVGYLIHFMFMGAAALVGRQRLGALTGWRALLVNAGIPITGTAIGWPLAVMWALGADIRPWFSPSNPRALIASLALSVLICALFYVYFDLKTRQIEAERRASDAQLKLLQGQMEPHFLFNTLANVLSLMDAEPAKARSMLESFVDYLRASLGGLRSAQHTLGDELALVQAYLHIVDLRMAGRLQVSLDVPVELRTLPLPPLTLQPLVENAVQHGLEPALDGGHLQVQVRAGNGQLVLTVQDDGLGLQATPALGRRPGSGTALANLRERLAQAHGDQAALELQAASPRGTVARLRLPLPLASTAPLQAAPAA